MSHTLHTPTVHTEPSQVIVIKEWVDWFLYEPQEYKNLENPMDSSIDYKSTVENLKKSMYRTGKQQP